jgi:hypothetical protein
MMMMMCVMCGASGPWGATQPTAYTVSMPALDPCCRAPARSRALTRRARPVEGAAFEDSVSSARARFYPRQPDSRGPTLRSPARV